MDFGDLGNIFNSVGTTFASTWAAVNSPSPPTVVQPPSTVTRVASSITPTTTSWILIVLVVGLAAFILAKEVL